MDRYDIGFKCCCYDVFIEIGGLVKYGEYDREFYKSKREGKLKKFKISGTETTNYKSEIIRAKTQGEAEEKYLQLMYDCELYSIESDQMINESEEIK